MRRFVLILFSSLAILGCQIGSAQAKTYTGPCLGPGHGGPRCHFWTARAVSINDGDTIGVRVDGDPSRRVYQVRFIGLQAMELHHYSPPWSGECHAVAAADLVRDLVRKSHHRVIISAQHPWKRFSYRIGRWIAVKVDGRWQDLGAQEMARGLTLWMPDETDWAWNRTYNVLGQTAAQQHIGMWNPTTCGYGPEQTQPMRLWVNWDPPGVDKLDFDGEWIKIQNLSPTTPMSLAHWWVRDSMLRRFTFPAGTVVAPGDTLTVHVGSGHNSPRVFYWGLRETIFQNIGDGAYLFDPRGDLRQYMVYPCVVACSDPNQGAIQLGVRLRGRQYIQLHNVSDHPVNLYGYILEKRGRPYDFGPNSMLQPGETMQVDVQGKPSDDSALLRHWGISHPILGANGDAVRLVTFNSITVACTAWGSARC